MTDEVEMPQVETWWNGEPCWARRVRVIVADTDRFPQYWAREFVGQERAAVEVIYPIGNGTPFYLDDEGGYGWRKVTTGHGSPAYGHRDLVIERIVEDS